MNDWSFNICLMGKFFKTNLFIFSWLKKSKSVSMVESTTELKQIK
jgi:hypothetical protein